MRLVRDEQVGAEFVEHLGDQRLWRGHPDDVLAGRADLGLEILLAGGSLREREDRRDRERLLRGQRARRQRGQQQREAADFRVYGRAARAANASADLDLLRAWQAQTGFEDRRSEDWLRRSSVP